MSELEGEVVGKPMLSALPSTAQYNHNGSGDLTVSSMTGTAAGGNLQQNRRLEDDRSLSETITVHAGTAPPESQLSPDIKRSTQKKVSEERR